MSWYQKIQQKAAQVLPGPVYDFIEGGADDECAISDNSRAFACIKLVPRVLANVSNVSTETTILGVTLHSPVIIAPTAPHKLVHSSGEKETALASEKTNTLMIVSCMASQTLEDIAENTKANLWFQLHIFRNREVTRNLVKRAERSGYKALVVTVDMPVIGSRNRDLNHRFKIPNHCLAANLIQEKLIEPNDNKTIFNTNHSNDLFDSSVTWEDIQWLAGLTDLPVILKGILHSHDAQTALEIGVKGIIVSNHGGRQLGQSIPPIQALPAILKVVDSAIPVLVDGGLRSGTDVLKAMALGAQAVLTGRPILWGLAVGGVDGITGVLGQFNRELKHAMTLCGLPTIESIAKSNVVWCA